MGGVRRERSRLTALIVAVATLGTAVLVAITAVPASSAGAEASAAKAKSWDYVRIARRDPTKAVRVRLGGGYVGRAKFLDNIIYASQRFKNASGEGRNRLYAIRSAVMVRLKEDYELIDVTCKQNVRGDRAILVPLTDGTRAFYPQEAEESESEQPAGEVGLNLGPFSVSVPVPGLTLYQSSAPQVVWGIPNSNNKHSWRWFFNPFGSPPQAELLPFYSHWVKGEDGIGYTVTCKILVTYSDDHQGGAVIKMKNRVRT